MSAKKLIGVILAGLNSKNAIYKIIKVFNISKFRLKRLLLKKGSVFENIKVEKANKPNPEKKAKIKSGICSITYGK
jgi:hypothetical protein